MLIRALTLILADRGGIAMPLAMLCLMVLFALVLGFTILSATEPVIANNQLLVTQARAIAEAGVERAVWGLNNPGDPLGIPSPLVTAPAPYDGSRLVMLSSTGVGIGGFRVSVSNGAAVNERNITADGWAPSDTAIPRAKQRITVTVLRVRFPDPPAALSVRGELQINGDTTVDARADTSCGAKLGTFTTDDTTIGSGAASVYGADGNSVKNQAGGDVQADQPTATFDLYLWSSTDLDALKALAKARGTYYQGSVTFNAANRMPNGLIFVDTTTGNNITAATPTAEFANVTIAGNAPADSSGIFSGWIVVNGSLAINGDFEMHGFIYAVNDFSYTGTGTGRIVGAVMSQNIRDTSSTTIDTNVGGNAAIVYDCAYARTGGGQVPQTFTIKAGTYKEVSG